MFLFADDMFVYIENTKESTKKKKIPRANEFSKVTGHKVNKKK